MELAFTHMGCFSVSKKKKFGRRRSEGGACFEVQTEDGLQLKDKSCHHQGPHTHTQVPRCHATCQIKGNLSRKEPETMELLPRGTTQQQLWESATNGQPKRDRGTLQLSFIRLSHPSHSFRSLRPHVPPSQRACRPACARQRWSELEK